MSPWHELPLGDVADSIQYGLNAAADPSASGPRLLRITDIQDDHVEWGAVPRCRETHDEATALRPGDIVFARTGATTGKSFLVRNCPRDAVFASYLIRVRLGAAAEPRFVAHFFRTPPYWAQIILSARGVAQPGVNATVLGRLKLPLPPLPPLAEQRRIADLLDRADAMRAKRREAIGLLDSLSLAMFEETFGRAGGCTWPVRPVADWVQTFETGKSVDPAEDGTPARNRVLKVSAVTSLEFLPDESKPVPDEYDPPASHFVRPGDLLFSRANTRELIGATALVRDVPANLLLPDTLWRFVWRKPMRVDPLFVQALFRSPAVRQTIGQRASGTSGSMKNISQDKVLEMETMLPPIEVQQRFGERVAAIDKLKAAHRASLAEMDALFASLQHRAYRGEL